MRRRFATLDVFTDRRFAGNPLAVVLEPQGLEGDTMQAIAREFGHPETVFVFAPADPGHRARLRIFNGRFDPAEATRFAIPSAPSREACAQDRARWGLPVPHHREL
jgi:trans-2,3-dihydro-3-hydroxyanthranilate isomerase